MRQVISIDEAILFERQKAEQRRQKALRKSNQSFKDKALHIERWIDEANKHEQISNMLVRLKNIEKLEKTK